MLILERAGLHAALRNTVHSDLDRRRRREELLFSEETLKQIWLLRRMITLISNDGSSSATERVLERLAKSANNQEFLANLNKEN